jgi:hypothetical protein
MIKTPVLSYLKENGYVMEPNGEQWSFSSQIGLPLKLRGGGSAIAITGMRSKISSFGLDLDRPTEGLID